jgi:hypothetical protein
MKLIKLKNKLVLLVPEGMKHSQMHCHAHDTHGTTALVRGYLPILSINTPEIGEITTLGNAVADMSIPTWKEVKPASETARKHTQHRERERECAIREIRRERGRSVHARAAASQGGEQKAA